MHIRKADFSDCADIATVCALATFDDDISQAISPNRQGYYHDFRAGFLRRCKKKFHSGMLMLVMVTDEQDADWDGCERVIGHAAMESSASHSGSSGWFSGFWDAFNAKLINLEQDLIWYLHLDWSISRPAYAEFLSHVGVRGPLEPFKDYWDLELLVVLPECQRKGVGGQLVEEAQRVAAKDNVPLLLVASRFGEGLYLKKGFRRLGQFQLVRNTYGEAMVWEPEGLKIPHEPSI